mmetsp:Transcript_5086/g.12692  ORF Transcript_5086/g.12692 Transcript_5086/m.12692 type:complete len:147 (+) Transcript_5086:1652-2092(+)
MFLPPDDPISRDEDHERVPKHQHRRMLCRTKSQRRLDIPPPFGFEWTKNDCELFLLSPPLRDTLLVIFSQDISDPISNIVSVASLRIIVTNPRATDKHLSTSESMHGTVVVVRSSTCVYSLASASSSTPCSFSLLLLHGKEFLFSR